LTGSTDFVIAGNTCTSNLLLAISASCTIDVRFTPSALQSRAATLTVIDAAGGAPNQLSNLTGTGAATSATVTPVAFGNQLNNTSVTRTATFTYTGAGSVTLAANAVSIGGTNANQFSQTNTCNGATLATSGTCTISVTFTPTSSGSKVATLNVGASSAALTGTGGTASSRSVTPAGTLNFLPTLRGTTSAAQTVTVTNTGFTAIAVTSIGFTGNNTNQWTQTNTCGSSIPVNGNCTISVRFAPVGGNTLTQRNSTLTIVDGLGTTTRAVTGLAL
jgi:hypothetical protein